MVNRNWRIARTFAEQSEWRIANSVVEAGRFSIRYSLWRKPEARIPLYYFSLSDGRSAIRAEAMELADAAMARREAAAYARELSPAARRAWREVVVTDAAGQEVLTVLLPAGVGPAAGAGPRRLPPKSHRRLLEQRRRRA